MKLQAKIIIVVMSFQILCPPSSATDYSRFQIQNAQIAKPKEIKSFYDLSKNYKSIHYWTWQKTVKADKSKLSGKIPIEFLIGPNSTSYSKETIAAIELTQRVFRSGLKPTKIWWIVNTGNDDEWAEARVKEIGHRNIL